MTFGIDWKLILGFVALLLWLFTATGCGPKAENMEMFNEQLRVMTEGARAAGMKAMAVVHLKSDKLGSLEQSLHGPAEGDAFLFVWADPATGTPMTITNPIAVLPAPLVVPPN